MQRNFAFGYHGDPSFSQEKLAYTCHAYDMWGIVVKLDTAATRASIHCANRDSRPGVKYHFKSSTKIQGFSLRVQTGGKTKFF